MKIKGEKLKVFIKSRMSLDALIKDMGLNKANFNRKLNGAVMFKLKDLILITKCLGISADYFIQEFVEVEDEL